MSKMSELDFEIKSAPADIQQRTPEWFKQRLGRVTASRVADVVAKTKTGYSTSRANYMNQLICENLTGRMEEFYQSPAMAWGTKTEPEARAVYEAVTGNLVSEVGFVPHADILMAGASPDGFVGANGLIEIKCPTTPTHIETLMTKAAPAKYMAQMQWQMACTSRQWCDFMSYDPRMPEGMRSIIIRVNRDDHAIMHLEGEVSLFIEEMDAKISALLDFCKPKESA